MPEKGMTAKQRLLLRIDALIRPMGMFSKHVRHHTGVLSFAQIHIVNDTRVASPLPLPVPSCLATACGGNAGDGQHERRLGNEGIA